MHLNSVVTLSGNSDNGRIMLNLTNLTWKSVNVVNSALMNLCVHGRLRDSCIIICSAHECENYMKIRTNAYAE